MVFESILPAEKLRPFVRCYWQVRGRGGGIERVLPDGFPEWILHLGDRPWILDENGEQSRQEETVLAGQLLAPLRIDTLALRDTVGVSFQPDGVTAFFGVAMNDIRDQPVPLTLMPVAETELRDRLEMGATMAQRAAVLDEILWRESGASRTAPILTPMLQRMASLPGLRVDVLATSVGWSRRHLERQFQLAVGVTPKTYLRIARFRRLIQRLPRNRPRVDWTQVALAEGYSDQSHMIREFRAFAGVTPARFLAQASGFQAALARRAGTASVSPDSGGGLARSTLARAPSAMRRFRSLPS